MNKKILIMVMVVLLLTVTGCNSTYWKESQSQECVKEKWIKGDNSNGQKYLVGMESGEIYEITDSFFKWQYYSSDIYNQIEEGKCYDITHFGWRIGFFSTYKVIYEIEEVKEK